MRMYLLSDNVDTLTGMRMSGVDGVVLHEEQELRDKLKTLLDDEDIAVKSADGVTEFVFSLPLSET